MLVNELWNINFVAVGVVLCLISSSLNKECEFVLLSLLAFLWGWQLVYS